MKVKTSELEGSALDWAVAVAMKATSPYGTKPIREFNTWFIPCLMEEFERENWKPSSDWSQGGALIEKYRIEFYDQGGYYEAIFENDDSEHCLECGCTYGSGMGGKTHLIAAMRAIVAAEIGETVDIPEGPKSFLAHLRGLRNV